MSKVLNAYVETEAYFKNFRRDFESILSDNLLINDRVEKAEEYLLKKLSCLVRYQYLWHDILFNSSIKVQDAVFKYKYIKFKLLLTLVRHRTIIVLKLDCKSEKGIL